MMKRAAIRGIILILCAMGLMPGFAWASEEETAVPAETADPTDPPPGNEASEAASDEFSFSKNFHVEWVCLKGIGGNYGGGVGVGLFTLNWKWFFWEIIHGYPIITGGKFHTQPPGRGNTASLTAGGTMIGLPLRLDPAGRHEGRLGIGVLGGAMSYGSGSIDRTDRAGLRVTDDYQSVALPGPFFEVEMAYLYRLKRYLSLYVGANIIFAIHNEAYAECACEYVTYHNTLPFPSISAFVGFRI